jgi:tetratricopeptide (TPR) repeat protein
MPKTIKKRIKKTAPEEEIKETVEDIKEKLKTRQRTLAYAIGIFLISIITVLTILVYSRMSTSKALEFQAEAYKLYYGDYLAALMQPNERYQKALELFKKSYEQRKRPDTLLYIANCYYELRNYDEALKNLNMLVQKFSEPKILSLAYFKMYTAYLKKNDLERAVTSLNNILSIKDGAIQDLALLERAKISESIGKIDEAKKDYKELINKFPKSVLVNEAKKRLGE